MRLMLLLLLLLLLVAGCATDDAADPTASSRHYSYVRAIMVRDCRYIMAEREGAAVSIIHAGDCDNPIHLRERAKDFLPERASPPPVRPLPQ